MHTYDEIRKAYKKQIDLWLIFYIIAVIFSNTLLKYVQPPLFIRIALAIISSIPIGFLIKNLLTFINGVDEYLRVAIGRVFITATGITLFLTSIYGFLQAYAKAPEINLIWVYVVFYVNYDLVQRFGRHFDKNLDVSGTCL